MKKALDIAYSITESKKQFTKKKFDTLEDIQDFQNLQTELLNTLPYYTRAGYEKNVGSYYIKTEEALKYPFISYGTKKVIQILMFDDDSKKYSSLEEYSSILYTKLGFTPTFITETIRGYQFGIILKNPIFKYHKNSDIITQDYLLLKALKKTITKKFGCDIYGSHRVIGVWRNPLQHNFIYSSKKYLITTLKNILLPDDNSVTLTQNYQFKNNSLSTSLIPSCKMNLGSNTKIAKTIQDGFYKGNRNNYLFAIGFKIVFEDRKRVDQIQQELLQINSSQEEPLTEYEVLNISKSVIEYSKKMYIPQQVKSKRGKLSNEMWEKKIHGIQKRRAYAAYHTAKQRTINSTSNIIKAIIEMFNKGIVQPKNKDIANKSNLSIRQIQRYKKIISTSNIFMLWIKSFNCINIVIRAYVVLIENSFKTICKKIFLDKESSEKFSFFGYIPIFLM